MSFNSKAFLVDRERLLEPDQELRGTRRQHNEIRKPVILAPPEREVSEYERNRIEDEYLKQYGI